MSRTRAKVKEGLKAAKIAQATIPTVTRKHWVHALTSDVGQAAVGWVNEKKGVQKQDYALLNNFATDGYTKVNPDDVLYIHCHGLGPGEGKPDTHQQALWITKSKYAYAKEVAEFLRTNGLNKEHKVLKLAACYSDRFAKELYKELAKDYPNITVYGYKKELVVMQGNNNGKLAGLEPPYIEKHGKHTILTEKIHEEGAKELFRARKNRVAYNKHTLENLVTEEKILVEKATNTARKLASLEPLARTSPKKQQEHKVKQEATNIAKLLKSTRDQLADLSSSSSVSSATPNKPIVNSYNTRYQKKLVELPKIDNFKKTQKTPDPPENNTKPKR